MTEAVNQYLDEFRRIQPDLIGRELPWICRLRGDAIETFARVGFPTPRLEEWRFTSVDPISRTAFTRHHPDAVPDPIQEHHREIRAQIGKAPYLTFTDGVFRPELSSASGNRCGVLLGGLREFLEASPDALEPHLARHAPITDRPFTALNTAFMEGGAYVSVPASVTVPVPIHLVFYSHADHESVVTHPRNLLVVGAGSHVTLVEHYLGLTTGTYFNNVVTELVVEEGAVVDHYRIQEEAARGYQVSSLHITQAPASTVTSHIASLGGGLVRNDLFVSLEEGASATLDGLFLVDSGEQADTHSVVDHVKPHGTSTQLVKGVLQGTGRGVFDGKVIVREQAQKTAAHQANRNLLLSEDAVINTKPTLEILANDVKCSHGSTIGQLDPDILFYLRSRGIRKDVARNVIIRAFAGEIVERISVPAVRSRIEAALRRKLPGSELLEE